MSEFFREVDEEYRAEQVRLLARRYGWVIGLAVILLLAAVGAWQFVAWQGRQRDARLSAAYFHAERQAQDLADAGGFGSDAAATAKARAAALASFAPLEASGDAAIRSLARLRAAGLMADGGDVAGAVRVFDQVAADGAAARPLRDAATLFAVQREAGSGDAAALKKRLATVTAPGGAFRSLALEAEAAVDLAHGQVADARRAYELVFADADAPQPLRERAATVLQALGPAPAAAAARTGGAG